MPEMFSVVVYRNMRIRMSMQPKLDSTRSVVTWAPTVALCTEGSLPTAHSPSWLVSRLEMARRGSRIAVSAPLAIFSASATTRSVACALPLPCGLRASDSASLSGSCCEPSGAFCTRAICSCSRQRRNADCLAAISAKGSKLGSSSAWPSAATATIAFSIWSSTSLALSMLHSLSVSALPLSQRAGSEKVYFQRVFTRSAAVISLQLSVFERNLARRLSLVASSDLRNSRMILRLTKMGTEPLSTMSFRLPLAHSNASTSRWARSGALSHAVNSRPQPLAYSPPACSAFHTA
mmetsp:Transcript_63116/g.187869  ORF Transcript_63116/g.187869 Transcript_63116/m.187869 type:complete len:292 (+) Transcript_63116:1055-1930(+)